MASELTKQWLRQNIHTYTNRDRLFSDVDSLLGRIPSLRPKTQVYTFNDGRTQLLLCLHGLIPIQFRSSQYNIPIAVWFTSDYPSSPPLVYVVPTSDMVIKANRHVDLSGQTRIDYLDHWQRKSEGCSLMALIEALQDHFSHEPPLYAKPQSQPVTNPSASSSTSSSPRPIHSPTNTNTKPNSNSVPVPPARPPKPPTGNSYRPTCPAPQHRASVSPTPIPSQAPPPPFSPQQYNPTPQTPPPPPVPYASPPPVPNQIQTQVQGQAQRRTPSQTYSSPQQRWSMPPIPPNSSQPGVSSQQRVYPDLRTYASQTPPPPPPPPQLQTRTQAPARQPGPATLQPPQSLQQQRGHARSKSIPAPNLMDEPDAPTSTPAPTLGQGPTSPLTHLPPRPPNPELAALHAALHAKLTHTLSTLSAQSSQATTRLQQLQQDLLKGEPAIMDESSRLEAIKDVCLSVVRRLGDVVGEMEGRVGEMRRRGDVSVDEMICSSDVVYNQLIDLVAEDNAIEDTLYHLHRAHNSGRIDLERFLRTSRALAEEQFMKRALIEKIVSASLDLSQRPGGTFA